LTFRQGLAARQSARYGAVAILTAVLIIGGALASMSLGKEGPQPIQTIHQPSVTSSTGAASQNSSRLVTTVQLERSSSGTSNQSTTGQDLGESGVLSVFLADAPASIATLKYLLVNVSSFAAAYEWNSSADAASSTPNNSSTGTQGLSVYILTVPSAVGMNVNLSSLQGQSLALGGAVLPAGSISSIVVDISGVEAFYTDGSNEQIPVVADGELPVPIQFGLQQNGSTDLTIDLNPNIASFGEGLIMAPVIHAVAVETGLDGTTVVTVTATESLPPITTTLTTTQTVTAGTVTTTVTTPINTTQTVTAPAVTTTVATPTTQTVTTTTGIVVVVTTTLPPATTTSTSTTTATSTTTQTSTTTLPPATTTSISTVTQPPTTATSTITQTSTATVTRTATTTVTTTKTAHAYSALVGPVAAPVSAGGYAPAWTSLSFALGALSVVGATALALPRFRRGASG